MGAKVIPFRPKAKPDEPLDYDPGVVPFNRANPHHVRTWNALFALGASELERLR